MQGLENIDTALIVHVVSWVFIALGSFFFVTGAIGMVRMPDLFTRMHAASVSETAGAGFLIAGMMVQAGPTLVAAKLFFIGVLLFLTGPVASHALAQAALHDGVEPLLHDDRRDRQPASPNNSRIKNENAADEIPGTPDLAASERRPS